ncbi:MAG: hypothetical protein APR63_09905 [Desulfuromonas sp. SDB]|nr:MAG: hypothetical protein APR63_09905 [Desulfuromonas sp. SDB]
MRKFVPITKDKFADFCQHLKQKNIDAYLIWDMEGNRNANLKYLSGHPEDAILILFADGHKVLIPWDTILAKKLSKVDLVVNFKKFGKSYFGAAKLILQEKLGKEFTLEVESNISYLTLQFWKKILKPAKVKVLRPNNNSANSYLRKLRMIKTAKEIEYLKKACQITTQVVGDIEEFLKQNKSKKILTEIELAVFAENKIRERGGDGISFETLVACPKRSWSIHTYPRAGQGNLNQPGLSLIDFGASYHGYCADMTVPFAMKKLTKHQKQMVEVVEKAQYEAIQNIKEGVFGYEVAQKADKIIRDAHMNMPHGLGHGLGLETHDPGRLSLKPEDPNLLKNWNPIKLQKNMVLTVEPGVYSQKHGGCRLEDDILVTANGCQILTSSRFITV